MKNLNPLSGSKKLLIVGFASILALASCGGDKKTEEKTASTGETCFYSYSEEAGSLVRWTAFKTSAKVPVGGQFNQANVSVEGKSTKITDILETVKFNIPTSSTNTGNPERDAKIVESFFNVMEGTDLIIGHVKDATGDNETGECVCYLSLNNIEQEVVFSYRVVENSLIQLSGRIDLIDFKAENAIAALNEVCGDLHKGEDGVAKTWSEVEIAVETRFNKECH